MIAAFHSAYLRSGSAFLRYCLAGIGFIVLAAAFPALAAAAERPRIGLVLGGGGARGTAHIGVLQVLEELHVPVDCIAGTSMGSLVAGAYVSGLGPSQMLERLSQVDWNDLFNDDPSHAETNYREKKLSENYYPGLEAGLVSNRMRMAHGVVGGQKIKLFFNTLVGSDKGERTIESLPLPLSVIATDIGTGDKVVFRDGSLSTAMRASMSIPALLAPVEYQGRHLVDGGLVDNIPVDEARARCNADVVIAVDVGSPLYKPEEVQSVIAVASQMINILTEQNATASRASLKPADVFIRPDLEGITAASFDKFKEGAERGRAAAEAVSDRLKRYAVPEAQYMAWLGKIKTETQAPTRIDEIQVADMEHVNPESVRKHLRIQPGDALDTAQLGQDIARVYGDGDYQSVDYSVLSTRDRNILRITPVEKSWGPDYLRFGLGLDASNHENSFALRAAYHKKWLNRFGGEWLSGIQIGEISHAYTEFYQPLDERQRIFVEPLLSVSSDYMPIYQDDNRIAQYRLHEQTAALNLGANIGVLGQIRLGVSERKQNASVETGAAFLPVGEERLDMWNVALDFDQFDRPFFPTRGWTARTRYSRSSDLAYSKLAVDLRSAASWGPYVLNGRLSYVGSPEGQLPVSDAGTLGGFLNLSGFVRNQVLAGDIQFGGVRGEKIIGKMPLGLNGDLRIGMSLEAGRARERFTETNLDGWQKAAAIYFGGETPAGPLYLAYGLASGGHSSFYLFLGLP